MPLERVRRPVVEDVVEELAAAPADVLALGGGGVAGDDGDEARAVDVLDDEPQGDDAGRGHDLQRVRVKMGSAGRGRLPWPSSGSG